MPQRFLYYLIQAAFGCFFLCSCENDVKQVNDLLAKKTAIEEGFNIESYLSQEARMKARLTAPYMLRYVTDSSYIEFPRTLHVDFFDTVGIVESIMDARYAKYREYERKVYLRDSVVVINKAKGDTLKTSVLWWDQNKQEFYTDKFVEVRQPDKIIFATEGLRAKQDLSEYWFFGVGNSRILTRKGQFE
ncbi:MAG TPA: LPS export ABC transporter periplasmic protein LptC [Flavitalea sp.]|nr:LPS export ABC transporter periplasmic protein LptC [Flavitalea sp.]